MAKYASGYFEDFNFHSVMRSSQIDETLLQTPACRHMFDWWKSFVPHKPTRSDFDVLDHVKAAPYLFLISVMEDDQFIYRIQGEEVKNLIGKNNTGKIFSKDCGDHDMENFALFLHEVIEHRDAIHSYGTMEAYGRSLLKFEALDFPLINQEGVVTHILGLIISCGRVTQDF